MGNMIEVKPEIEEEIVKILVVGVGGGGNNAVERMYKDGIKSVDLVCVNTDKMCLNRCSSEGIRIVQIGEKATGGRGAGAKPEKGKAAAEENKEDLDKLFDGVHMVFVTCGMGGGTGTGAAPIIAKLAKDKGILTVGVVTEPFSWEGGKRKRFAAEGIKELKEVVDTLIVIPNDRIFELSDFGKKTGIEEAFHKADEVLRQGVQGITDIIQEDATINLDFADVETVMRDKGIAHLGIGFGEGENRALDALYAAINNPLLQTSVSGASDVIINLTGDVTLYEAQEAVNELSQIVNNADDNVIFGVCTRSDMQEKVMITVIATGMPDNEVQETVAPAPKDEEPEARPSREDGLPADLPSGNYNTTPSYQRPRMPREEKPYTPPVINRPTERRPEAEPVKADPLEERRSRYSQRQSNEGVNIPDFLKRSKK
ncbi:MAG: cell division protein FtsZ [Lachnospiraceae bacterium]|nr:cell division protein FtsZ [Lachnospiraceae bacterium]